MRLVSIWIIFVSTILHISNAYYLSTHALEWLNASNYCLSYCNSSLASIHSVSDHLETLDLISRNPNIYTRVWLGLNDIAKSDIWQWSDGSPFDFGGSINPSTNFIIKGQYPWRGDEPDFNDSDQCVALEVGSSYIGSNSLSWVDRKLTANYHFICNECSSKTHKYAAVNGARNYSEAEETCNEKFGTTLASIHSESDMMEARTVCKQLTSSNGCWIGLKDIGNRIYEWSDGTAFDYGTTLHEYPWYISEPGVTSDQPCTFLDPSNGADPGEYLWDDYWCHLRRPRALCNAPSEICNHKEFNIIRGSISNWSFNGCKSMIKTRLEAESIALLSSKQYFNSLGILSIDMMYSITAIGLYGNAGIALYFDKNNCNNYYYAGIWGGHDMIFLGKHNELNGWNLITHSSNIGYNLNTFYTLSIKLIHGTEWNIYLNEKLLLTVSDNEFDNKYNKLSGYIAIRNINAAINVKSLYISGDVKYENDNNMWYTQCTETPTNAPTINTIPPTTQIPSQNPTKIPTNNPSNIPSVSPTIEPTMTPSNMPTTQTNTPTDRPTNMPSKITTNPTSNPTNAPTFNPINAPTFNPTIKPTIKSTTTTTTTTIKPINDRRPPIINTPMNNNSVTNISGIMYENVYIKQPRNQLIWIIGIPIGFTFFCVFGVYLLHNYYKEINKNESKDMKLELKKLNDINNETNNETNNEQEEEEEEIENDSSEKNLLIASDIPNGIDDENGALNAPMNTNDREDSECNQGENDSQSESDNQIENENHIKLEMAIDENKNENENENDSQSESENETESENDEKSDENNDGDNDDVSSDYNLETIPLNYRMKPEYTNS